MFKRVIVIVLDGVGIGEASDAANYGDVGSHSLGNTARMVGGLNLSQLATMGLGNLSDIAGVAREPDPAGHHAILRPRSAGKDSISGHWELMGCRLERPFTVYPDGMPAAFVRTFVNDIGRGVLGNEAASGTEIIQRLGDEHVATGKPIMYTSQDSVCQIAAHEDVVPVAQLYQWCMAAREIGIVPAVARIIARPFAGKSGGYFRTPRRKDFGIAPPQTTVLDELARASIPVTTIGKIDDLFCGRGIGQSFHTRDNQDGMRQTLSCLDTMERGFLFVNLVDFDTMWGHRNDPRAYALGLEDFDLFLLDLLPRLDSTDLLMITSDHGNDPTTASTDHSRENVPLIVYHSGIDRGCHLGRLDGFDHVGGTVLAALGVDTDLPKVNVVSNAEESR